VKRSPFARGLFCYDEAMTRDEIIEAMKGLDLPAGGYIVFGSCPLAMAGIRESGDIDMLVSPEVLEMLKQAGWRQINKGPDDKPYVKGDFEAHSNWKFSSYSPTLEHLLASADVVDGIPFASLAEVRKWKVASGRPKDIADVQLIDDYLAARG